MTIEQEFFEAFGIEKITIMCDRKNCDKNETNCAICHKLINEVYPPITPENVLELIKIISKKEDIRIEFYENKFILAYDLCAYPDGCICGEVECDNVDFNLCVLELTTKINKNLRQDWQQKYKHELQTEVRGLFNER